MRFDELPIPQLVLQGISKAGFSVCTPIQEHTLPITLTGTDIAGQAQTGTGKTLAFVVPILEKLIKKSSPRKPSVLILTPTRELASQVVSMTRDLSRHNRAKTALLIGGANFNKQVSEIRAGADIVHFDVMDGVFVPMLTFGPPVIRAVRTALLKDAHLIVVFRFVLVVELVVWLV